MVDLNEALEPPLPDEITLHVLTRARYPTPERADYRARLEADASRRKLSQQLERCIQEGELKAERRVDPAAVEAANRDQFAEIRHIGRMYHKRNSELPVRRAKPAVVREADFERWFIHRDDYRDFLRLRALLDSEADTQLARRWWARGDRGGNSKDKGSEHSEVDASQVGHEATTPCRSAESFHLAHKHVLEDFLCEVLADATLPLDASNKDRWAAIRRHAKGYQMKIRVESSALYAVVEGSEKKVTRQSIMQSMDRRVARFRESGGS